MSLLLSQAPAVVRRSLEPDAGQVEHQCVDRSVRNKKAVPEGTAKFGGETSRSERGNRPPHSSRLDRRGEIQPHTYARRFGLRAETITVLLTGRFPCSGGCGLGGCGARSGGVVASAGSSCC